MRVLLFISASYFVFCFINPPTQVTLHWRAETPNFLPICLYVFSSLLLFALFLLFSTSSNARFNYSRAALAMIHVARVSIGERIDRRHGYVNTLYLTRLTLRIYFHHLLVNLSKPIPSSRVLTTGHRPRSDIFAESPVIRLNSWNLTGSLPIKSSCRIKWEALLDCSLITGGTCLIVHVIFHSGSSVQFTFCGFQKSMVPHGWWIGNEETARE